MSGIKERSREVWGKVTGGLESGMDQAQADLGRLQEQAAKAPDASKAHIHAKIGETHAKQEADQEKLRSNLAAEVAEDDLQIAQLEAAAAGVSGDAHGKIVHDIDQVRAERDKAHQKLVNNLEAEVAEIEGELTALEKAAADAPADAAARIMARAEWARVRRDAVQGSLQAVR